VRASWRRGTIAAMPDDASPDASAHPRDATVAPEDAPLRLFTALWPDDDAVRDRLAAWQRACVWSPDARPTPPAHLHVTLHFLGPVPRDRLAALDAALGAVPPRRFDLTLDRAEVWSNGVAVLCPAAVVEPLVEVHAAIGEALHGLGLPTEARPYRPHVTLARKARGTRLPPADAAPPAVTWHVHGFVLVESRHGYTVLRRWG